MTIDNRNDLAKALKGSKLSPFLKERVLVLGQEVCLENASELIQEVIGVRVSDTTIHRALETYGEIAEQKIQEVVRTVPEENEMRPQEVVYCEADGSMILTREEGWKEVKLGRIFRSDTIVDHRSEGQKITASTYVGRLGRHEDFIPLMDTELTRYRSMASRLVFVTDGALWIRNWISQTYPNATQILDFYHAVEHLGKIAEYIKSEPPGEWVKRYAEQLLREGGQCVIRSLRAMPVKEQGAIKAKRDVIRYFTSNAYRMDYPAYDEKGYYIGSGAIESAHRTVVQKRLKLAGQRWSMVGAQHVLNLRVLRMSDRWNLIRDTIREAA